MLLTTGLQYNDEYYSYKYHLDFGCIETRFLYHLGTKVDVDALDVCVAR